MRSAFVAADKRLLSRWLKDQLRKIIESFFPMLEVMRVFVHVPDVRHVLLFQVSVDVLADANEAVLVAARDV